MRPSDYYGLSQDEILTAIGQFFNTQRDTILKNGTAASKSASGSVPDNSLGNIDERTGERERTINGRSIVVNKSLEKDFKLAIKHPSMFTALLEMLSVHFSCFAIIRNPLSVLLSWNSVTFPVSKGHAPAAEAFDRSIEATLRREENIYARQLLLLDWYFSKYKYILTQQRVLKYEDIIATGGKALAPVIDRAVHLNESLSSKNANKIYNRDHIDLYADLLLNYKGSYFDFYSKNDIIKLF